MSYTVRNFAIEELVPPETIEYYEARGGKERAFELFDSEGLLCIDLLRDDLGPCTINNWLWGGLYRYSGFRPANCTVGADYSMHRLGKGFDLRFRDVSAEQAREHIRSNRERFAWVRGLELGLWEGGRKEPISWCHIDGRNVDGLKEFWA